MKQAYYYIDEDGKHSMPVGKKYFQEHGVNPLTWVWFNGLPDWVEAREVPSLESYLSSSVKPSYANIDEGNVSARPPRPKMVDDSVPGGKAPRTWLFESIVVTILCFLPFGLVALVYAARVSPLWRHQKYAEAVESSKSALLWVKWSFAIMLVGWFILFLISVLMPSAFNVVQWDNAFLTSDF